MNVNEIVKYAINTGFDDAIAELDDYITYYVKIINSKPESILKGSLKVYSLFLRKGKKVTIKLIEDMKKEDYLNFLNRVKHEINSKPDSEFYGINELKTKYKPIGGDKKIANLDSNELIDISYSSINGSLDNGATRVDGTLSFSYSYYELASSKGISGKDSESKVRISLRAFNERFSSQITASSRMLKDIDPYDAGKEAASFLQLTNKIGRIDNGIYDIIYLPSPGGSLLYNVDIAAAIGNVESGSFLKGKLNQKIANEALSIYDDGCNKKGIGNIAFDDEGYPTQRTPIIKDGELINYLFNTSKAIKYNKKSTGNAGIIEPQPNIMDIEFKKVASLEDMIKEVKKGILVTNTWYTRFRSFQEGIFSTVPRDVTFYIENGEIKFGIKEVGYAKNIVGIRITDSIPHMLNSIELSSKNKELATSWEVEGEYYFAPAILTREAHVTVA